MSREEQIEATTTTMEELENLREMKDHAAHNVPLAAVNNAHATLDVVQSEVSTVWNVLIYGRLTFMFSSKPFTIEQGQRFY